MGALLPFLVEGWTRRGVVVEHGLEGSGIGEGGRGKACATAEEVAKNADVDTVVLTNTGGRRELALGPKVVGGGAEGPLSPIAARFPDVFPEIGEQFQDHGAHFLDAPCTGSGQCGEERTRFMVGGEQAAFERAKPYFEIMGKVFYYCGAAGQGLQAKLTTGTVLRRHYAGVRGLISGYQRWNRPQPHARDSR